MNEQFTKEQLAEIVLWWAKDDGEDCPIGNAEWANSNIRCIEEGDEVVEYKTVYNSYIYLVEGIYFEVTFTRDNCGYWSDGESYDPTIQEVFPKQITKTIYVNKKPE